MYRNRVYLKFLNALRPQFIQLLRPQIINTVDPYRCFYSLCQFNISLSAALINQPPALATPETEIKSTKRYKRGTRLRFRVETLPLLVWKLMWPYIFRNSSIVKRKPKFLWMGFVIFFLEMSYFKSAVQFAFLSIFEFSVLGVLTAFIGSK